MKETTEITVEGGGKGRRWWEMGLWMVLAFAVGFFWQKMEGADRSEFGGHPDEAAHYVTGLFVHDAVVEGWKYLGGGMKGSPVAVGKEFANNYYAHYPKIGLGVWPPFFYVVQTAWTLPFSVSRASMLLLLCGLAAVVAGQLFSVLRREFGFWAGIFGGVMWLSLPLVRAGYGMVMAETLCTILIFGAMMAWGDFLDSGKRGDAVRFGIFAGLAIMTKGTGMALALAAPLALVGSRRWGLLLRFELWLGVILVAILAGPWTWATCHLGRGGWVEPSLSWRFTSEAIPYYLGKFGRSLGWLPLGLFLIGVWVKVGVGVRGQGRWVASGALILSVMIFQSLAPVGLEARHLISVIPSALMFVVAGMVAVVGVLESERGRRPIFGVGLGLLVVGSICPPFVQKGFGGFAPLAEWVVKEGKEGSVTMVSSESRGEGMFIAEVAMREKRPRSVIERASKILAKSEWNGTGYARQFANDEALLEFLMSGKIRYLVVDEDVPEAKRREHHDQLPRVIAGHRERFRLVASSELTRGGKVQLNPVRLYEIETQR